MWTQSLGALNDNVFRTVLKLIITAKFVSAASGATFLSLAQGLYVLPFILLSGYAGQFADKYSKTYVLKSAKLAEIVVALFALFFFWLENVWGLFFAIFLMGLHSTFFSPPKYGILPEILTDDELSKGNGYLEFWTFISIVLGIVFGGLIKSFSGEHEYLMPGYIICALAVAGYLTSLRIRSLPAHDPTLRFENNPFKNTLSAYRAVSKNRGLTLSLWAMSYFWFLATVFDLLIYMYAKRHLELSDLGTSILLTALMLGIGFGSIIAGKVSEGKVELGLVPIGGVGMGLSCLALQFTSFSTLLTSAFLILLGISSGFFIVPLNAFYQRESPEDQRGRFLALTNFTSFSAMALATVLVAILADGVGLEPKTIFLIVGFLTLYQAYFVTKELPNALVRCINWIVTNLIYRIKVYGSENVPSSGGVLLVSNHISYIDALLVQATVKRPVRFLMFKPIFENRFIRPVAEAVSAIPITAGSGGSRAAIAEARASLERGEVVCIFAEGSISRIGQLLPFKTGLERIMADLNAPIVPVYLDQLWGSIFSFRGGKFFKKIPKELPYPVSVIFGDPLPSETPANQVRTRVQELSSVAFTKRKSIHKLLHSAFLDQAKRTPLRLAIKDPLQKDLRFVEVLAGVLLLQKNFRLRFKAREKVGVLLPPGAAGVLSNLTLLSIGAIPVNLNHTAGKEALSKMYARAEIETVLTSFRYLERIGIEKDTKMLPVESFGFEKWERYLAIATASLLPAVVLRKLFFSPKVGSDDIATVMFSSGSTGEPKGVLLSHSNISSNCEAIFELLELSDSDKILGSLPLFHSFGFTGTMMLPLLGGIPVVFSPNPLDASQIVRVISKERISLLITTPTFLQLYARKADAEDFSSLKYIVVGAEKLRDSLRGSFEEKFSKIILEGYGCTELSPVALVNVPDFIEEGQKQVGNKSGTVGRPLPGVAIKIVDPETFIEVPSGNSGMLLVKGPNVMRGYLGDPEKSSEVIRDGYYLTGDIASVDDEGFVVIEDRLSRFAKIGGEMVPHLKIEEELHEAIGATEQVLAVTSIPDDKRGERIVVLSTVVLDLPEVQRKLKAKGLPNLWIPESFKKIEQLPILGTGKLDLRRLKELAQSPDCD